MEQEKRILIIDDDRNTLILLHTLFKQANYHVTLAKGAVDALPRIYKMRPHIIISDIAMNGMSGLELCRSIRKEPLFFATPFIFLTANGNIIDKVSGYESGATDILIKPVDIDHLLRRVEQWYTSLSQFYQKVVK